MEHISTTYPKSRKEHKCNYCLGKIPKGATYGRTFMRGDEVYVWKSHAHCEELSIELKMHSSEHEGVDEQVFKEYIDEAYSLLMHKNGSSEPSKSTFQEKIETLKQYYESK